MNNFPSWLTQQMVRNVRGFNLDAYLLALEGWRRGLTLTWYLDPEQVTDVKIIGFNPLGKSFSLRSDEKIHFFYRSRGDLVANMAVDIGTNKQHTKEQLQKAQVPTPEGKSFAAHSSIEEIINYGLSLGFPLVVKPTFGSLGKGVTTNITSQEQLRKSIEHIHHLGYKEIIVEKYFHGQDYRVYVVDKKVVGVTKRIPANVVGDGEHNINQLIVMKNKAREKNPYLRTKLIKIDEELEETLAQKGMTLFDIPASNERVFLKEVANISAGGDPVEAMDILTPEIEKTVIQALQSVPGLKHAGVDILVGNNECIVLEINPTADISMHIFPMYGQPINVPEAIIDFYFPESQGMAKGNEMLYFDYLRIRRLLRDGLAQEYHVNDVHCNTLHAKRYVISGQVQKVGFRRWIRREALKRNLYGYTRNLNNGNVVVVVGGAKENVDNFKQICWRGSPRSKVENVREYTWPNRIKAGFEIRRSR